MKLLLFLCLIVSCHFVSAQTDTAKMLTAIKAGVDSIKTSLLQSDWPTFTDLMHPTLIEMTGGKEKFQKLLKDEMVNLLKEASIDTMASGNILQLINHKGQWQCIVESFMQMTILSTTISTSSCNIGVSFDNGFSWKFIRVSEGLKKRIAAYFPDLSPALKIPATQTTKEEMTEFIKNYKVKYPQSVNENTKAID